MIKISIITPVYNAAGFIGETISSVLKQSYKEWEMIIVDDGSTDNSAELVRDYTKKDDRIKFFHQSNSGASAARNTAITNAVYDWLLFLDADDWIREDYFEKMIPVLENDSSIDVVHCGWTRVRKDGTIAKEIYGGEQNDMFPSLAYYSPFAIHCCVVRKKLIEEVGGFDPSFKTCVDWDLWQRVARTGAKFCMIKETMAFYRTRSHSLSSDVNQFCTNGLQVISNAYTVDPRVLHSKPEYVSGLQNDDLIARKYYFIVWAAGVLIGQGKQASHLLKHVDKIKQEDLDGHLIGEILLDSLIIPAEQDKSGWYRHWYMIKNNLQLFLSGLESQSCSPDLADKTNSVIERHVISECATHINDEAIGTTLAKQIDIESTLNDIILPADIKRVIGLVQLKEKFLGLIELNVLDSVVTKFQIKDAIATKFSWQILYQFFSTDIYPLYLQKNKLKQQVTDKMHDKIGWELFLQELWQKPAWTEKMFYDPVAGKKEKSTEINAEEKVHIEISELIPIVKTKSLDLNIVYHAGGVLAGRASCKVHGGIVTPQMIRAAISINSGYEICRIVVREALIGQKIDNGINLHERLRIESKKRTNDSV